MGGKASKKLVPNRPLPKSMVPVPTRMAPKRPVKMVPPDGGWGWMVVFGACLSQLFFPAVTVAFGVLFSDRLKEMGAGATSFTLIGNGLSTVWSFVALLAAPLSELFGHRRVTMMGGVLAFLAMTLSAYSTNLVSFGFSYSLIGGIAGTLCTFNGYTIIPLYFSKRKGLANGIVSSSSALGKIAMAPLVRLLLDGYGYEWACLLVAALSLHSCVAGMLYHPPKWHQIPEEEESDCEIIDMTATVLPGRSSQGLPSNVREADGKVRPKNTKGDDEDEDIIFVMPDPSTPSPHQKKDDEVVLFSRVGEEPDNVNQRHKLASIPSVESAMSWAGSLEYLPPVDNKVFEDNKNGEPKNCCDDFIVVKVFRMLNYSLLKDPKFHLVAWPNALCIMGYLNSMFALPGYVRGLGYTPYQSAFAISVFSATEVVFRLCFAALSDFSWFPLEKSYIFGILLSSISMTALTLMPAYEWILLWVAINGVALSLTSVLLIHLMIKYLGKENYAQVIGFCSILNGVTLITGGFLIGASHDHFGSYVYVFYILTVFIGAGAIIWISHTGYAAFKSRYNRVSVQAE